VGDETVLSDSDELTDERVRLNAASFSNNDAALNLYEWPDKAIVRDSTAIEVNRFNDRDPLAKIHIDNTCLSNRGFGEFVSGTHKS
jgi:hypothetical protein